MWNLVESGRVGVQPDEVADDYAWFIFEAWATAAADDDAKWWGYAARVWYRIATQQAETSEWGWLVGSFADQIAALPPPVAAEVRTYAAGAPPLRPGDQVANDLGALRTTILTGFSGGGWSRFTAELDAAKARVAAQQQPGVAAADPNDVYFATATGGSTASKAANPAAASEDVYSETTGTPGASSSASDDGAVDGWDDMWAGEEILKDIRTKLTYTGEASDNVLSVFDLWASTQSDYAALLDAAKPAAVAGRLTDPVYGGVTPEDLQWLAQLGKADPELQAKLTVLAEGSDIPEGWPTVINPVVDMLFPELTAFSTDGWSRFDDAVVEKTKGYT